MAPMPWLVPRSATISLEYSASMPSWWLRSRPDAAFITMSTASSWLAAAYFQPRMEPFRNACTVFGRSAISFSFTISVSLGS